MIPGNKLIFQPALGGRLLALGLLLLGLWNPLLPLGQQPLELLLLLDDSASMERQQVDQTWREISAGVGMSEQELLLTLIRFGGGSALEVERVEPGENPEWKSVPPRVYPIDPNETNIEQAIRSALVHTTPGRQSAILLVSDGVQTEGDAARALAASQQQAVPAFWLRPEIETRQGDAWVHSLKLPARAGASDRLPITVVLNSSGAASGRLLLKLDGKAVQQRAVELLGGQPEQLQLQIEHPGAGVHLVEASIKANGDTRPHNDSRTDLIQVDGPATVLYIGRKQRESPLTRALTRGGWPVTARSAAAFDPQLLTQVDLIILDDIDISALPDESWRRIGRAVRSLGKGLIVLGGPHAFGGGGYRHSALEPLLPVTSEARRPLDPAAVLFLLDKSGSMDRREGPREPSRLAIARQAIQASAGMLEKGDLSGLISFDLEPEVRLPMAPHDDPSAAIDRTWNFSPHGGTRLAPALIKALETLAATAPKQKIVLLVSDGLVEEDEVFDSVARQLTRSGIDLIALAIGDTPETGVLQRLTSINRGRLLRVDEIARLPRLMQQELRQHRSARQVGPVLPRQRKPLTFMKQGDSWPPLDAYMVTRERPGAEVYLSSEQGDPLLASWFAGTGRVVTLPGGLGNWAEEWRRWDQWGRLLGGLVEWAAGARPDPLIHIRHSTQRAAIHLEIDRVSPQLEWDPERPLLQLKDPAGREQTLLPQQIATGRSHVTIPARLQGRYDLVVRRTGYSSHYAFYRQPVSELASMAREPAVMEAALEQGMIRPWRGIDSLDAVQPRSQRTGIRMPMLLSALFIYLTTLVIERDLFRRKRAANRTGPDPTEERQDASTEAFQ